MQDCRREISKKKKESERNIGKKVKKKKKMNKE
jgi:hypothetical protein